NNGLDCFLKRVIKPSLELARSRSSQRAGALFSTSMLDFRVAAEINPKVLGEFAHILDEN
nr:transcriptional coactivator Hfi1/transcriptional adapter 1 [Tanacetum cinerariifolium]